MQQILSMIRIRIINLEYAKHLAFVDELKIELMQVVAKYLTSIGSVGNLDDIYVRIMMKYRDTIIIIIMMSFVKSSLHSYRMRSEILNLRKTLHQYPEISGQEVNTASKIKDFINLHHPTEIIDQLGGGHGIAAIYRYSDDGPTVAIRCELDALPIEEANPFEHRSKSPGVSHKCGHDGHMSIVAGLIVWIKEQDFDHGTIVLLFQPAEETGRGAPQVIQDLRFQELDIDYIFALHNLPGEAMHQVLVMDAGFSAEVISFAVKLNGAVSHASEPEKGINPTPAIAELIKAFESLDISDPNDEHYAVLTPVFINMGEKSYGISPGTGEVHYTIRTWNTGSMKRLRTMIETKVKDCCHAYQLDYKIEWFEHFAAASNDAECNKIIREAAIFQGIEVVDRSHPCKFGEDFGWFTAEYRTGMFGLGAGVKTPNLHNAEYDFPDEIIDTGMKMFQGILSHILQQP